MKKYTNKIFINGKKKKYEHSYTYNYRHTKGIVLSISDGYVCISADMTVKFDKEKLLNGYDLFNDSIKKALLIHLLHYSKSMEVKKLELQIDDEEMVTVCESNIDFPITSLINEPLKFPFTSKWNDMSINTIVSQTKSSADQRMSALYAFICSKSKFYDTEKFIYLWMSFNGMYGYFAEMVPKQKERNGKDKEHAEADELRYLMKLYDIGNDVIPKKQKSKYIRYTNPFIEQLNNFNVTRDSLENGEHKEFSKQIETILYDDNKRIDISSYGYLLTQFSYYYRCTFIHANKPIPLFSFNNEIELKSLKIINSLLEEFIENNLNKWFDSDYVKTLKEKAEKIK